MRRQTEKAAVSPMVIPTPICIGPRLRNDANNCAGARAQGETNADFARSPTGRMGDNGVDTNGGHAQSDDGEDEEERAEDGRREPQGCWRIMRKA